ncbi:SH3 domain-containing protein [Porphyridium purpureum]|uniref:SH3 domain-containing protein n=1 Tax=Porphyridium purpureum TaxID=35688 RepID=A0A5J4Z3E2_PORPP|nr:SH3 domain-containing protein [Porphyridium purpureum]|eukprot:POR6460..scf295_1
MPLGISGVGVLQDDVRRAKLITNGWVGEKEMVNARIGDNGVQIPKWVVDKCYGVCFLFYLKAGFIYSGGLGTGFVMSKLNRGTPQQRWSGPSAVAAGGMGWGLQVGAQKVFHVIFLHTKAAVQTFASHAKANFGGDIGVSVGPIGRNANVRAEAGNKGVAASYSYSFSQGLFAGLNLDGTVVGTSAAMNRAFYGEDMTVGQILKGEKGLDIWKQSADLAKLYMNLDVALSSLGQQSFDGNYGESSLASFHGLQSGGLGRRSTVSGGNWWDTPSSSQQGFGQPGQPSRGASAAAATVNTWDTQPQAPHRAQTARAYDARDPYVDVVPPRDDGTSYNARRYGAQAAGGASSRNDNNGDNYSNQWGSFREENGAYAGAPDGRQGGANQGAAAGYWEDYFRRYGQPTESFDTRYRQQDHGSHRYPYYGGGHY